MKTQKFPINFEHYLKKLDFSSPPAPTLANLTLLQERHTSRFPFQTLSTVMKKIISVDWADLEEKIITTHQGGYCYELNLLFYSLLAYLGYEVTILSGHVIQDTNLIRRGPRGHILLKTVIDGEAFISDVGHGGLTPTTPFPLFSPDIQTTAYGDYRIVHTDEFYYLQTSFGRGWWTLYGFDLHPQHLTDIEMGNWYVCTHPKSFFRTTLMVARTAPEGTRHALLNNRYSIHKTGAPSTVKTLEKAEEILAIIEGPFGLNVPQKEEALQSINEILRTLNQPAVN